MLDGQRVLIVEDYSDAAQAIHAFLTFKGLDCKVCPDSHAALYALSEKPIALILDVGLPGMSGLELAKVIRARPDGDTFVLVGYSGYGRDEDRRKALEAGMDAYFVKPADVTEILQAIERLAVARRGWPEAPLAGSS